MTLKEYQIQVDNWIKTYGVRYFDERTNMILLMEEVGELARLMARHYGEQSFKQEQTVSVIKSKISDEIADILFVLTCLSNQMELDLESIINQNFEKKNKRDTIRHKKNTKLTGDHRS